MGLIPLTVPCTGATRALSSTAPDRTCPLPGASNEGEDKAQPYFFSSCCR